MRTVTLQRALLASVGLAILAGMVPAGLALDRRLASALEARARMDLELAPRVLADRTAANADFMMMQAKEFAHASGLADALAQNDHAGVLAVAEAARSPLGNGAVVIDAAGSSWVGPPVDPELLALTRAGKMPVVVARDGADIRQVALAPVQRAGRWIGAAGVVTTINESTAGVLSGLTRSDVVIVSARDGMVAASTLDSTTAREIATALGAADAASAMLEIVTNGTRRLVVFAPYGAAARVVFSRSMRDELALLPALRRTALFSALGALMLALVLGAWMSTRVARPVRELSDAAAAMANGEFGAPLPHSRIREVQQVAETFDAMRRALAARLADLGKANEALVDRNARLSALQADLMQRDRLSATGRLVTQLAHEIRNPVANLRNCLELVRRRVEEDATAREFTDLAIDELLRMHELAEQMLDLNRPRDPKTQICRPVPVALEVAALSSLGRAHTAIGVSHRALESLEVPMAPDALKQVLLNLVQNAREAHAQWSHADTSPPLHIEIAITHSVNGTYLDVLDNGPGIAESIRSRMFDPFFTTKDSMHGVGLGLFVAEGLVRTVGGQLTAGNRETGGAWFRLELPVHPVMPSPISSERDVHSLRWPTSAREVVA